MTEKVLTYDRSVVPQETPWDCGPAACQVVLNTRGIHVSETTLIAEIGTTVNGTDYVGLIERVLDKRVPDARYTSVYLDTDPPTRSQKNTLWEHLKRSIDAGYGVVMNWVAPPGNHPVGIKGSQSPIYRGTIYHYVAAMGYDDTPGKQAVWIADSGFAPFGYWVSFEQCATLIPPKGYAYTDLDVSPDAPEAPSAELLAHVMGGSVPFDRYRELLPKVVRALKLCDADTVKRRAMWFAQIGHESGGLRYQEEIASGAAYEGRTDLGNIHPGDGVRFKGRDFIQVTGRSNYTALSRWAFDKGLVPTATFFVDSPEKLATDTYAFLGTTWYWTTQRNMNDASDAGDLERATRYINGGLNGFADRQRRYTAALAMGDRLMDIDDDTATADMDEWEALMASGEKVSSWSIFKTPGEKAIHRPVDLLRAVDARAHEDYVIKRARAGIASDLNRIALVASGKGEFRDPDTVAYATWLLADISGKTVDEVNVLLGKGMTA